MRATYMGYSSVTVCKVNTSANFKMEIMAMVSMVVTMKKLKKNDAKISWWVITSHRMSIRSKSSVKNDWACHKESPSKGIDFKRQCIKGGGAREQLNQCI
jgi:hypothetical protein